MTDDKTTEHNHEMPGFVPFACSACDADMDKYTRDRLRSHFPDLSDESFEKLMDGLERIREEFVRDTHVVRDTDITTVHGSGFENIVLDGGARHRTVHDE